MSTLGFMCAGLVAATVNYPFDRVKGHMMGRAFQVMKKEVAPESTVGAFRSVVARHGPLGLLQGLPTRSVLHAVVWCVVGAGREICEKCGLRERAKQRLATCGHDFGGCERLFESPRKSHAMGRSSTLSA